MRAPDKSELKKTLWSEYKRMCKQEIAGWNQLDEPAGVAKVWYMPAVGRDRSDEGGVKINCSIAP